MRRLGFEPYVENLDSCLEGGIPEGSWVSVFGPPGSYKTLHALAFALAGLSNGDRVVYVSTEMDYTQLLWQAEKLGWKVKAYSKHFTSKILDDGDYGNYELVWIDLDSLRSWALKLNRIIREEKESGRKKTYFWYNDPILLTHAILVALGAVGALERSVKEIDPNEILYARVKDGLYKKSRFQVNKDIHVRVIIDSISPFILGKYSVAGRILTDMKVRLAFPQHTYLIVSHVSRSSEDELGASIGHIVDGRIKLWIELDNATGVANYYGWIVKMRETNHSRQRHRISIVQKGDKHVLKWE